MRVCESVGLSALGVWRGERGAERGEGVVHDKGDGLEVGWGDGRMKGSGVAAGW